MRRIRRELGFLRRQPRALLPGVTWRTLEDHTRRLDELVRRVEKAEALSGRQQVLIAELTADAIRHQEHVNDPLAVRMMAVAAWIEAAARGEEPLVSIVLPTYDRPAGLMRAVQSVRAQAHRNWELVVVDDGSAVNQLPAVEALGDPRIRAVRQDHGGLAVAVNLGLAQVRGELIAYLEDDNTMDPGWLRAAAWAMETFPGVELLYGAMVWQEDEGILGPARATGLPTVEFRAWDRGFLERHSFIHIGAVVHRRGLAETGYETALERAHDYDFMLRATRSRDPLALPVVAGCYATGGRDRLSVTLDVSESIAAIQARHGFGEHRGPG